MATIFQMTFPNAFSWVKIWILIKISLKFVSNGQINNIPAHGNLEFIECIQSILSYHVHTIYTKKNPDGNV